MSKSMCALLIVLLTLHGLPLHANDEETIAQRDDRGKGVRASVDRHLAEASDMQAVAISPTAPPPTRVVTDRSRKQVAGGGKTAMVIGLLTTVAGAAGAVYMLKQLQKSQDQDETP